MVHQLLGEIDVVLERILRLFRVGDVAGVADRALHHPVRGANRIDAELEVIDVVQRVKHAEHVDPRDPRLLHESVHDVVSVRGVSHRVGASQ